MRQKLKNVEQCESLFQNNKQEIELLINKYQKLGRNITEHDALRMLYRAGIIDEQGNIAEQYS